MCPEEREPSPLPSVEGGRRAAREKTAAEKGFRDAVLRYSVHCQRERRPGGTHTLHIAEQFRAADITLADLPPLVGEADALERETVSSSTIRKKRRRLMGWNVLGVGESPPTLW